MLQELIQQFKDIFINDITINSSIKLLISMILGLLIGSERQYHNKNAGFKTHALVSMGSTLFVIISLIISEQFKEITMFDPLRMASQIIVGVGFIGGGTIFLKDRSINGLSTAANLWIAAGVGMAIGYGLYGIGIVATLFSLIIFIGLNLINNIWKWIKKN